MIQEPSGKENLPPLIIHGKENVPPSANEQSNKKIENIANESIKDHKDVDPHEGKNIETKFFEFTFSKAGNENEEEEFLLVDPKRVLVPDNSHDDYFEEPFPEPEVSSEEAAMEILNQPLSQIAKQFDKEPVISEAEERNREGLDESFLSAQSERESILSDTTEDSFLSAQSDLPSEVDDDDFTDLENSQKT